MKEVDPVHENANEAFLNVVLQFAIVESAFQPIPERLSRQIDAGDWVPLMEDVKGLDQSFRKARMSSLRKKMPKEGSLREKALQLCNAVTFDLIGISKVRGVQVAR